MQTVDEIKTFDDFAGICNGDLGEASRMLKRAADLEYVKIESGDGSFSGDHFHYEYKLKGAEYGPRLSLFKNSNATDVSLIRKKHRGPFCDRRDMSAPVALTLHEAREAVRWLAGIQHLKPRQGPYG